MLDLLLPHWPWFAVVVAFAFGLWASAHIVLYKRDSRAAIAWVGLVLLAPLVGSLFYFLFGINRIQRRAHRLRRPRPHVQPHRPGPVAAAALAQTFPHRPDHPNPPARPPPEEARHPLLPGTSLQQRPNG